MGTARAANLVASGLQVIAFIRRAERISGVLSVTIVKEGRDFRNCDGLL
jgi:hypothetical protein